MKALICGDRRWGGWDPNAGTYTVQQDVDDSYALVASLPPGTTVVQGMARGGDDLAHRAAHELGYDCEHFPAHWRHGPACGGYPRCRLLVGPPAGSARNTQMLEEGLPDVVIWCHHDLPSSIGTKNMVKQAILAGVPVRSWREWLDGTRLGSI